jgi:sterol desaturase/sphingolipid hydroxylase (fatty acid hydroxylase superfamily)
MNLDLLFKRLFGDEEPAHWGSGWISGTLSVLLGGLGVAATACLVWPQLLTSPELRALLPLGWIRAVIELVIGLAFLLGLLSTTLRRRKVLGFTGMGLALAAGAAGVLQARAPEQLTAPSVYLGLDWFLLNMALLALLFVPLEKTWPLRRQSAFRPGWTTDGLYFLVSHLLVQASTWLTLLPATVLFAWAVNPELQALVRSMPHAAQFVCCAVIADLTQYTLHRLFHRVPWLWPFHAVHHSSQSMDWLAGSRLHVVDVVLTRGFTFAPLFLLGFDTAPLYAYLVFVSLHAVFIHANVSWRFPGWLERVLVTPRFHHWHHATEVEAVDRNFAVHFPWIDRLFGTYYGPLNQWPSGYGLAGNPVPEGFTQQLTFPIRSAR